MWAKYESVSSGVKVRKLNLQSRATTWRYLSGRRDTNESQQENLPSACACHPYQLNFLSEVFALSDCGTKLSILDRLPLATIWAYVGNMLVSNNVAIHADWEILRPWHTVHYSAWSTINFAWTTRHAKHASCMICFDTVNWAVSSLSFMAHIVSIWKQSFVLVSLFLPRRRSFPLSYLSLWRFLEIGLHSKGQEKDIWVAHGRPTPSPRPSYICWNFMTFPGAHAHNHNMNYSNLIGPSHNNKQFTPRPGMHKITR